MSTASIDDLNKISVNDAALMTEILSENNNDVDENAKGKDDEKCDSDENEDGIEIPKSVTPVHEVEEFFKAHLQNPNNKVKEKLVHNALFDLLSGQACNKITSKSYFRLRLSVSVCHSAVTLLPPV